MKGLFLLKIIRNLATAFFDVFGFDSFALGDVIRVDHAFCVEEDEDHLFGSCGVNVGFYWAWLTLLNSLH